MLWHIHVFSYVSLASVFESYLLCILFVFFFSHILMMYPFEITSGLPVVMSVSVLFSTFMCLDDD